MTTNSRVALGMEEGSSHPCMTDLLERRMEFSSLFPGDIKEAHHLSSCMCWTYFVAPRACRVISRSEILSVSVCCGKGKPHSRCQEV